jgi:hypothetical protein
MLKFYDEDTYCAFCIGFDKYTHWFDVLFIKDIKKYGVFCSVFYTVALLNDINLRVSLVMIVKSC